jgi:hypothetical protein
VSRLLETFAVSVPCAALRASRIFFWPGGKSMNYADLTNRRGTYSVATQCILDAHFCAAQELGNKAIDEIFYSKPVEDFKLPFLSY